MPAVNPLQLQMFMKPSEVANLPGFNFSDSEELGLDDAALSVRKLKEANRPGHPASLTGGTLRDEIVRHGVKNPVELYHSPTDQFGEGEVSLHEGHHRFFVQEHREQQGEEVYLPVEHGGPLKVRGLRK